MRYELRPGYAVLCRRLTIGYSLDHCGYFVAARTLSLMVYSSRRREQTDISRFPPDVFYFLVLQLLQTPRSAPADGWYMTVGVWRSVPARCALIPQRSSDPLSWKAIRHRLLVGLGMRVYRADER